MRPGTLPLMVAGAALLVGAAPAQQGPAAARPAHRAPAPDLRIEIDAGAVSVEARDVALGDLLGELSRRSGLAVDLEGSFDDRVTLRFERLPMRAALEEILRGRNFVLRYVEADRGWTGSFDAGASRLWVFARRSAGGAPPIPARAGRPGAALPPAAVGSRPVAGGDARARRRAVSRLIAAGGDQAAARLAALALSDPDPSVRREAVHGLGEVGGAADLGVLGRTLGDPDREVREAALEAITDLGGDEAAPMLAAALAAGDPSLREQAVYALGEIGGGAAIPFLRQALEDDDDLVREAAAEALGE